MTKSREFVVFGRRRREREELMARIAGNLGAESRIALTQELWTRIPQEDRLGEDWVSFEGDDVDGYVILGADQCLYWVAPGERGIRDEIVGGGAAAFSVVTDDRVIEMAGEGQALLVIYDLTEGEEPGQTWRLVMTLSSDSKLIEGLRSAGVEEFEDDD